RERRGRPHLAGEQLLEVGRLQTAGAGELHERRRQRGIGAVGRRRQRRSAWRGQREQHLIVLEIGRLQPRFDAVRQLQDGDADVIEQAARGDRARRRRRFHQRSSRRRVVPGGDRRRGRRGQYRLQIGVRGSADAVFLRRRREHDAAVVAEQRFHHRRGFGRRDRRQQLLHEAVLVLDAGAWLVVQEVAEILARERGALALVAFAVRALVEGGHPPFRSIHFGRAEAEVEQPLGLDQQGAQAFLDLAVLRRRAHREGVDAATQGAVARAGAEELRIGAPRQFVESLVDDV